MALGVVPLMERNKSKHPSKASALELEDSEVELSDVSLRTIGGLMWVAALMSSFMLGPAREGPKVIAE